MQLAIWNHPAAEFLVSGLTSSAAADTFEIERTSPGTCIEHLRAGLADLALLPTIEILDDPEAYDVLPVIALSTWRYPYAQLVMKQGLGELSPRIAFDPQYEQERIVADLVLREHYRMTPTFVPCPEASLQTLRESGEDGSLLVGVDVAMLQPEALALDLGQEWYELANYPMVWGLLAMRKGEATPEVIRAMRRAVKAAERQRSVWVRAQETSESLHEFFSDDLRVRLDDLVIASLTELRQYLYYHKRLPELIEIPFAVLAEDEEGDDDGNAPLL